MTARRHAVLVASSSFPNEPRLQDLKGPENDVDVFGRLLSDTERGAFTDCAVLKNRPHHEVLLKINQAVKCAGKDDLVLIYYSGHGKLDAAGRLHLATRDTTVDNLEATSIPVQSIRNYLDLTRSTRTLLILDCCFSGAVGDAFLRSGVDDQLQIFSRGRGTYLMSASTGLQVAREDLAVAHGAFTRHLLCGLESGDADLDRDGLISVDELYSYVHERMRDEGFQEPMKWDLNVKGELILSRSPMGSTDPTALTAEERLREIAASDVLPGSILEAASELLSSTTDDDAAGDPRGARRELLDGLLLGGMKVSDFIEAWYRLDAPRPPPPNRPEQAGLSPGQDDATGEWARMRDSATPATGSGPQRRSGLSSRLRPVRGRFWRSRTARAAAGIAGVLATAAITLSALDVDRMWSDVDWSRNGVASRTFPRAELRSPAGDSVSSNSWQRSRLRRTENGREVLAYDSASAGSGSLEEILARDARSRAAQQEIIERYNQTAKGIIRSIGR